MGNHTRNTRPATRAATSTGPGRPGYDPGELREARFRRARALAEWHVHRRSCPPCAAVRPGDNRRLCCRKGQLLLTAVREVSRVIARLTAPPGGIPDQQLALF